MRRSDDVFFFVLIDFLVQVFFFGLLIYVLTLGKQSDFKKEHQKEANQIERLIATAGVTSLTELTDELSKLGPINELKGTADFIARVGGIKQVEQNLTFVANAGGVESLLSDLEKLRKLEEGAGKPHCDPRGLAGRKIAVPLAVVVADDTHIRFQGSTPKLEEVLKLLDQNFGSVRELRFDEFRRTFAPLEKLLPNCKHTIDFREATRLVDGRDAARFTFYLHITSKR